MCRRYTNFYVWVYNTNSYDALEQKEREESNRELEKLGQRLVAESNRRAEDLERIKFEDELRAYEERLWNAGEYALVKFTNKAQLQLATVLSPMLLDN